MRISVFPKGELASIVRGEISIFDWIKLAKTLSAEGLELYSAMFVDNTISFTDRERSTPRSGQGDAHAVCVPRLH